MPATTEMQRPLLGSEMPPVADTFNEDARIVLAQGDSLKTLCDLPSGFAKLIISSPPYNIGKAYEQQVALEEYLRSLDPILRELVRVLSPTGSLCWQVGNYVENSEVFPLDIWFYPTFKRLGLKLRNRVVWHFEHGLH